MNINRNKIFLLIFTGIHLCTANALIDAANTAFGKKEFAKAEILLKQAEKAGANKAIVAFNLGNLYYYWDKPGEAIAQYEQVILLAPAFKDSYMNLGKINYLYGNYTEALDYFFSYHHVDPKDEETILLIADVFKAMRIYDEAEIWYRKAIDNNPASPDVYIASSFLYTDLNDNFKASQIIASGLERNPENHTLMEHQAQLFKEMEMYRESAGIFQSIISTTTNRRPEKLYDLNYQMADSLYLAGFTNLSVYTLEECIQIDSEKTQAIDFLEMILYTQKAWERLLGLFTALYPQNRTRAYLGLRKLFQSAYNERQSLIVSELLTFYEKNNIRDDLYLMIKNTAGQ